MKHILVIDDEIGTRESLKAIFWNSYQVSTVETAEEGLILLKDTPIDLLILDVLLPGKDGIQFLREVRALYPDLPVIMLSAVTSTQTTAEAIRLGAVDYITKPFDVTDVRTIAENALSSSNMKRHCEAVRRRANLEEHQGGSLIGESPELQRAVEKAEACISDGSPLLIQGEHGVGKELLARYIHSIGGRKNQPLITLQFASFPESLAQEELFGVDSSTTPNVKMETLGRLDLASGGTLVLKEAQTISKFFQNRLSRVIREKSFIRVNGRQEVKTRAQMIFITSHNGDELTGATLFERSLFRHLRDQLIVLPPLRKRRKDIPLLAYYFLNQTNQKRRITMTDIDPEAMRLLRQYSWPGNIEELRDVIEHVALKYPDRQKLTVECLPCELKDRDRPVLGRMDGEIGLQDRVDDLQRHLIVSALSQTGGKQVRAARLLKTTPRILNHRMKQLNIQTVAK